MQAAGEAGRGSRSVGGGHWEGSREAFQICLGCHKLVQGREEGFLLGSEDCVPVGAGVAGWAGCSVGGFGQSAMRVVGGGSVRVR